MDDQSRDLEAMRMALAEWNKAYCEANGVLEGWCNRCGEKLQTMSLLTSTYMGCPRCERQELEHERVLAEFVDVETEEVAPLGPAIPRPRKSPQWVGWNFLTKAKG